ncbi:hypothetical protein AAG906_015254 [Vitis piasezkii]
MGFAFLVILHLDSGPLQVKRTYSFLLSGLQMEVNWCQEDQKFGLTTNGQLDLRFPNGTGSCWRKRLPLSNGRLDQTAVSRSALIKIMKSSELTSGRGNQNKAILILSVLLGPSAFFFFVSLAAISLVFYRLNLKICSFITES